MFERFTEKARRIIFFGRYEASQFGSPAIETEHLLLAILREDRELMDRVLGNDHVSEPIRRQIEARTKIGERISGSQDLPLSHESKRVLAYGAEEAERMGHKHVAPAHLLLGLMREENCLAASILKERGLRLPELREEIAREGAGEAGDTTGIRRPGPGLPMPPGFAGSWMAAMQDAGRVLMLARHEAAERRSPSIETMDLLRALSSEKEFEDRFPGAVESVRKYPRPGAEPRRERVSTAELPFSEDSKLAFTFAAQAAARMGQRTGPAHLLLGILSVEACAAAEVLRDCGLTAEGVRAQIAPPLPPSDPEQGRSYV